MSDEKRRSPQVQRGPRRIRSLKGTYHDTEFRSMLEVRFAQELEKRGVAWRYEPERIGAGHYLVDFYLPDFKCWVEVKGRFEPRDDLLLPNVAINLKRDRGERLFLYMEDQAFVVGTKDFTPLTHATFWETLQAPAEENELLL
jgi:hypothetical protein